MKKFASLLLIFHIVFLLAFSHVAKCQSKIFKVPGQFNNPDISATDQFGRKLEGYKLTDDSNQEANPTQTTWASVGDARLIVGPTDEQPFNLTLFHWNQGGFSTLVQMMTPQQSALLADAASKKYNVTIKPRQIIQLPLGSFNCSVTVTKDGEKTLTQVDGKVQDLKKFPLVIQFDVPNISNKNSLFRKDLQDSKDGSNLTCFIQSVDRAWHKRTLVFTPEQSVNFIDTYHVQAYGSSNDELVYVTGEQLKYLSLQMYKMSNASTFNVTLTDFEYKLREVLVKGNVLGNFMLVPVETAFKKLSLMGFPKDTDIKDVLADVKSIFQSNEEVISVNVSTLTRLKKSGKYNSVTNQDKVWGIFNLGESVKVVRSNFIDWAANELSFTDQLNMINKASNNEISWSLSEGTLKLENATVAEFNLVQLKKGIAFDGFTMNYLDYAFRKQITLPFSDARTMDGIQIMETNVINHMTETISQLLGKLDKLENACKTRW